MGRVLVNCGWVTPSQLTDALHSQVASKRLLGEELVAAGHASQDQINKGLMLQRMLMACTLSATLGWAFFEPQAHAAQAGANMAVSAFVVANAKLNSHYQVHQLTVSAADVAQGYVDAPAASRFSVTTNSRTGYAVDFHPLSSWFDSVHIEGLSQPGHVGAEGGTLVQRKQLPGNWSHELHYRFMLRSGLEPGHFHWPLQLTVRALP